MTTNNVLLWLVLASTGLTVFRALRPFADGTRGWLIASLAVLAVTGVTVLVRVDVAGYAGMVVWLILLVLPSLFAQAAARASGRHEYRNARRFAALVRVLHPADGWREEPEILHALELSQAGLIGEANAILDRHRNGNTPVSRIAWALHFRINGAWTQALEWLRGVAPDADSDPNIVMLRLRALGETGELAGMLACFEKNATHIEASPAVAGVCRVYALAFCGRKQAVRELAGHLPAESADFWVATAEMAAGEETAARSRLESLLERVGPDLRPAIEGRLAHPVRNAASVLTPEQRALVARIEAVHADHERYLGAMRLGIQRAWATWALIAANVAMFAIEIAKHGSTSAGTLLQLGAMDPEAVRGGGYWRLLAATFLHFGPLHLAMNMLGLLVLGPFVESAFGIRRYLLVYFASGVGSMACIVFLTMTGLHPADRLVVGASGAIFGLVGATAVILWRGWRTHRSQAARKRLGLLAGIVALQTIFDATTPHISVAAHSSGVVIGFLVANLLRDRLTGSNPPTDA